MKKLLALSVMLHVMLYAYSYDITGLTKIYSNDNFTFYSEDDKDYKLLIFYVIENNKKLNTLFKKDLPHITFYIYSDHKSVAKKVFNEDEKSPYCGFADIWNRNIYITSPYDPYKYKTIQDYYNTAVHELVHQYYSPKEVWLREGLAHYLSNLYLSHKIKNMPKSFIDFKFYTDIPDDTFQAYVMSGWLVKYIYEERCKYNFSKFALFANNPKNYQLIDYSNEKEMFNEFNKYMLLNHMKYIE